MGGTCRPDYMESAGDFSGEPTGKRRLHLVYRLDVTTVP